MVLADVVFVLWYVLHNEAGSPVSMQLPTSVLVVAEEDENYWRGRTEARLQGLEEQVHALRADMQELLKTLGPRLDNRLQALTASVEEVKRQTWRMLGIGTAITAVLIPLLFFGLQRFFPSRT
jgi:ABC-type Fe3+-hydroxamate transport system substrate-binding protein